MAESDIIYSEESLPTKILMTGENYEITIIVEDSNKEFIYEEIFKKILKNKYNIDIIASGGKNASKAIYGELRETSISNPNLKLCYLLDADFEPYIFADEMIKDRCCIYLQRYNIESYLIDDKSSYHVAKSKLRCRDSVLYEKFDYSHWKSKVVSDFSKLFFLYCYIKKNHSSIKSTSRSHYDFIDGETGFTQEGSYEKLYAEMYRIDNNIQVSLNEIKNNYKLINGNDYFNIICGKFLMTSLKCYIQTIVKQETEKKISFKDNDFEWLLLGSFDESSLTYVKDAIDIIINSP